MAVPCTRAITVCGIACIASITRMHRSNTAHEVLCPIPHHLLQIVTARERGPLPGMTTTLIDESRAMASTSALNSEIISIEIALKLRGRFR